jgi:CO/xanthine dehydrogenase Mo-binding subunit
MVCPLLRVLLERRHFENTALVRVVTGSCERQVDLAAVCRGGSAIEQTNFNTYNVMRIDEMPRVEVVVVPTGDVWGGVGEPTIAVAAPAVLNAIFAATGKRVRTLPLMNHDLSAA